MVSSPCLHRLQVVCLILNIRILKCQVHDMIDIKPYRTVVSIFVDNCLHLVFYDHDLNFTSLVGMAENLLL